MQTEDIRSLLRASPFRPFTIVMASEKTFHVPHPDFAFLTPPGMALIIGRAENNAVDILDVPLIARIEVPELRTKRR